MAYTEYITIQGDRWDSIAYKAYGDATTFAPIADANPHIPMQDTFEGGVRLLIPILENEETTVIDLLPPWKRTQSQLAAKTDNAAEVMSKVTSVPLSFDKSYD